MELLKLYLQRSDYRAVLMMQGEFADRQGVPYTVHLLHQPFEHELLGRIDERRWLKRPLRFGETPLVITTESERLSGLVPSRAQLRVLSEVDGQFRYFLDLAEGAVMLVLWRQGALEWMGTLDPESYQEDYTKHSRYFVDLSFSDFGRAKRLSHRFRGKKSLGEWLRLALMKSLSCPEEGLGLDRLPLSSRMRDELHLCSHLAIEQGEDFGSEADDWQYVPRFTSALDGLYAQARAFYVNQEESLSLYEMIDGILTSLGLRLEQRAGRFVVYDRLYLSRQGAYPLSSRGADAVFVADETITALNIELEDKSAILSSKYEPKPVTQGDRIVYPRIDRPEMEAYSIRYSPHESRLPGAYTVTTYPATLGQHETFVALCLMPVEKKAGFLGANHLDALDTLRPIRTQYYEGGDKTLAQRLVGRRLYKIEYGDTNTPGGNVAVRFLLSPQRYGINERDGYYLNPICLGYERWLDLPRLAEPTRLFQPWAYRQNPLLRLSLDFDKRRGLALSLEAKLFASFYPSLYQALDDKFAGTALAHVDDDNNNVITYNQGAGHMLGGLRSLMLYCSMTITRGDKRYALTFDERDLAETYRNSRIYNIPEAKRLDLRWAETPSTTGEVDEHFFLSFGGSEFRWHAWNDAESEHIILSQSKMEIYGGKEIDRYKDYWRFAPIRDKGLYIPPPPISGEVELQIYGTMSLSYIQERRREHAGISQRSNWAQHDAYKRNNQTAYESISRLMETGKVYPSYILLKDVRLSVVSTKHGTQDKPLKRHARVNLNAYEVKDIKPLLTNDPALADSSPNFLTNVLGEPVLALYYVRSPQDAGLDMSDPNLWRPHHSKTSDTSQILTGEYFAHYGKRRHCIEGRFDYVRPLGLMDYAGNEYFALQSEWDLRSGACEYRLAQFPDEWYSPTLMAGEVGSKDNPKYLIQ